MKNKMNYGEADQLPGKIESKDVNVTVSIRFEGDLLDMLKLRAAQEGKPYQTLAKQILRQYLDDARKVAGPNELAERLARLESILAPQLEAQERRAVESWHVLAEENSARIMQSRSSSSRGRVKGKKRA